jgi:serine/threonine-protein kinase RsbW
MRPPRPASAPHSPRLDFLVPASAEELSGVRDALGNLGLPSAVLADARLLLNELVTNSIRHSGLGPQDQIRIRAEWSGNRLRVDVFDRAGGRWRTPVVGAIRPPPGARSGWGLYVVDRVARRWGAVPGRFWFELESEDADRSDA